MDTSHPFQLQRALIARTDFAECHTQCTSWHGLTIVYLLTVVALGASLLFAAIVIIIVILIIIIIVIIVIVIMLIASCT